MPKTTICKLVWPDGGWASGRGTFRAHVGGSPILYEGDIARLTTKFEACREDVLRALFEDLARETGATLTVTSEGAFLQFERPDTEGNPQP